MYKTIVGIEGMACGMCEEHICSTIKKAFEVNKVKASRSKKCAEIITELPLDEKAVHLPASRKRRRRGSLPNSSGEGDCLTQEVPRLRISTLCGVVFGRWPLVQSERPSLFL